MILLDNYNVIVNGNPLFAPVKLHVQAGHCAVIMGSSGIGKTSLLDSLTKHTERNFQGYSNIQNSFTVFQDNEQLFQWMTIEENLRITTQLDYKPIVARWNLSYLLDRKPNQISGGQRQRFTLIRAICSGSDILLCDEPLSALDSITALQIAADFRKIIAEINLTVLWVTHNLTEAKAVGDKIYYLTDRGLQDITNEDDVYATILVG